MDCGDIREILGLDRCVSCGVCTDACPSARHGGIVPDAAVASVTVGETPERIWDCLMCHRCSMVCPQKIDVAEMMALLRGISDGTPERYLSIQENSFPERGSGSFSRGRCGCRCSAPGARQRGVAR